MPATPFTNIVVPIDFSELSAMALRYAAGMAHCSGARLAALYANSFSPPPYFTESRVAAFEQQFRESFEEARRTAAEFIAATLGPTAPEIPIHVVEGLPADAITRFAAASGADLLVMGTHGRSGINRWMLGSVTERVLRESRIPVLTVRQSEAAAGFAIRNVLCPVNDSPLARRALRLAMALAACFGAKVTALHVQEPGASGSIPDLCSWVAGEERGSCRVEEVTRQGDAAAEIVSASAEAGCDLAVIGARHRAFFDTTVLGTTTIRVLRHARCPVLTVLERDN